MTPYRVRRVKPAVPLHPLNLENGFTLVELMVGMAIGLVVLLGLTVFFSYNSRNQNELERSIVRLENSRFALDTLAEDVLHAGYYARYVPGSNATYSVITPCPASTAELGWNTAATQMPPPISGQTANPSDSSQNCLNGRRAGTGVITLTRTETGEAISAASTVDRNLYIQTTGCSTDSTRVIISTGPASNFTLKNRACNAVNTVQRLSQRTYFVSNCNNCTDNDGIPSLKRGERIGNQFTIGTVAEGVEQLQFEYGIDTNNDGQTDEMLPLNGITGVAPYEWRNVVALRIHMLVRSAQPDPGYVEQRTFSMGPLTLTPANLPAGFKRTLMTTTVPLPNVAGRRE